MSWMTVIADLHGRTPPIRPDSRALLLAGDICPDGGVEAQYRFLDGLFRDWLNRLAIPVIGVPGNHDFIFEEPERLPKNLPLIWLKDSGCEVNGLTFWGCPWTLKSRMAFEVLSEEQFESHVALMPSDVDVVITHNPPLGLGDRPSVAGHLGSLALRYAIWKKRPQLHVFGHVHEGRGHWNVGGTYYVNATLGTGHRGPILYEPWGLADNSWRKR